MTPLAALSGGEDQETLIVCDVRVVQVVSCGGCSGTPSAVCCLLSSLMGPEPTLLKA